MLGDSCICIDYDCGFDPADFFFERVVTARKEHTCCECGEQISTGQRYQTVSAKWNNVFNTFKTCLPCMHVRQSLMVCGWVYGELWRDVQEWFEDQGIETEDENGESWLR